MKTPLFLALLGFAMTPATIAATATPSEAPLSQLEMNKAVARRVFDDIFNRGKFEAADEIYARDFVNHGLHNNYSLEEDQAAARWEKQVVPDLQMTVDLMVAQGDLVTVLWTGRGTNTAPIGWLPATGVKLELRGISIWRVVDGKLHEEWSEFDDASLVEEFVSQLKWQLMAILLTLVIVLWMAVRLLRHRLRAAN